MQCPHCDIAFSEKDAWKRFQVAPTGERHWEWSCLVAECPECEELVIHAQRTVRGAASIHEHRFPEYQRRLVYPLSAPPRAVAMGVPEPLKADYQEAYQVLLASPKASAALSRRVLQAILVEQGYLGTNLAHQIDEVLEDTKSEKALPLGIRRTVDAIRHFGNFSAHPMTDVTSLQIIDVEPEEAEWCVKIVERLFDHYYVRPAEDQKMLDDLNEKLSLAGKPAAKS